jgi:hypothetical protein
VGAHHYVMGMPNHLPTDLCVTILSSLRSSFLGTTVDSVNLSRGIRDSFGVSRVPTCEDHRAFTGKSLESVVVYIKVGEQETRRRELREMQ